MARAQRMKKKEYVDKTADILTSTFFGSLRSAPMAAMGINQLAAAPRYPTMRMTW
eukprot:CAMPEP_0174375372 /NCGR_PEP_ID=MMETSP0811_2-20130205/114390_2 /TAXON_ID=73025 ORGANISM="Eutreptiella gymnastica-like, Strain CCMP1594" /NCGR_SAMPLE_ID=MMETSP0811_2 /ASSEMBLY_ACC=CAM_ASM_000667 /LENGTH=54 /DNA_ID=CAMNT_0015525537 /DNA_START=482 /DNA_END=643 /DNA_ORIENTATION=-